MSRQIQIRRGTSNENDAFTGAIGEITMDTTNKTLRVHDGSTVGGTKLAKQSEIPDLTSVLLMLTPGKTSNNITVNASGTTYVADQNGWVQALCAASTGTWVRLINTTRNMASFAGWNGAADGVNANIYVAAGDSLRIEFNGNYTFKFILPAIYDNE